MSGAEHCTSFEQLLAARSFAEIAALLLSLELESGYVSREDLRDDPFGSLTDHPGLEVLFEPQVESDCSVAGYFRETSVPPALIVHPSGAYRRDIFTILHEYGHYVQAAHSVWSDIPLMLPSVSEATLIGETVADEFASELLLPAATFGVDPADVTARELRDIFECQHNASRSAIAYRAVSRAQPGSRLMIAVLANWGEEVLFARSEGDLMAPGRGVDQPALRALALQAKDSPSMTAYVSSGAEIIARSGWKQSDFRLEIATDYDGYAFAIGRPARRFGASTWSKGTFDCSRPACEAQFEVNEQLHKCSRCDEWRCPECKECECGPLVHSVCDLCYMRLSPAEVSGAVPHEC